MKTLQEIAVEVTAVQSSLAVVQADIQALIDAQVSPATDPVVEVDIKTQSGTETIFVPKE